MRKILNDINIGVYLNDDSIKNINKINYLDMKEIR